MRTAWSAALTILVACVLLVQWEQYKTLERMAIRMSIVSTPDPNQLVETWISGGQVHQIVTTRGELDPGETKEHWRRRHLDDVQTAWNQFPPDG